MPEASAVDDHDITAGSTTAKVNAEIQSLRVRTIGSPAAGVVRLLPAVAANLHTNRRRGATPAAIFLPCSPGRPSTGHPRGLHGLAMIASTPFRLPRALLCLVPSVMLLGCPSPDPKGK